MISEELIQQYERDGAVCIKGVIDPAFAASVLANLDVLIDGDNDRWTTIRGRRLLGSTFVANDALDVRFLR